ncbi:patatin-like phospholipase family protein [Halomarina litorea]|uniref:patatin-like phospholipase family protein n=1 Tax=Halomarina litorea TaxID=2961595 RepID=UPI0020C3BB1A|nr:patatin-like phospholipase family protein [Halomarina sp. BCD28]
MSTNVAIACQGGGSHTAFTAGALRRLLPALVESEEYDLVGLSGTSGGAFSAAAAWYGLLDGGSEAALRALRGVWMEMCAETVAEEALVNWTVALTRVANSGVPIAEVSPYFNPLADWGQERLRAALEAHIDFEAIPDLVGPDRPRLVVGTVDINAGKFETFANEAVTPEVLLSSSAVPELFEAVEMDGHYHWDGLFSQNPPIHELMDVPRERKPEELWVVQINPQGREDVPKSLVEIADRRNELSGNLSLNQELRFIERVNDWVERGLLPEEDFAHTEVRRIELGWSLGAASKLNRSRRFIRELMDRGEQRAEAFLDEHHPALAREPTPALD